MLSGGDMHLWAVMVGGRTTDDVLACSGIWGGRGGALGGFVGGEGAV